MALNIILRLSNSPSLNHCRRTFSTALNQTRLVIPTTIIRNSTTCNSPIIRPVLRRFSTSASLVDNMQPSISEDIVLRDRDCLLKEIESEISRAVDLNAVSSQGAKFPEDFPFKLDNDVPGVAAITLKRLYKSENMVVTVHKSSFFTSITAENYHSFNRNNFIIHLTVEIFPTISMARKIAFNCSAYCTGGISIGNVYESDNTKGLFLWELNKNLQKELKKYLEKRGITPSTIDIMLSYMLDKANREKLRSLYKFKKMIEA